MVPLNYYLILSGVLFSIGTAGVFLRRNLITVLLSIEIMLNAVNLTFVAVGRYLGTVDGQIITFFVMTVAAAEVALCASKQGAFWRVHDLLYTHQDTWAPLKEPGPFLATLADSAKISRKLLLTCLASPDTRTEIQSEAEGSERAGASSTPSFYIEGGLMSGAQPVEVFRRVLDSVVATKRRPGT